MSESIGARKPTVGRGVIGVGTGSSTPWGVAAAARLPSSAKETGDRQGDRTWASKGPIGIGEASPSASPPTSHWVVRGGRMRMQRRMWVAYCG